MPAKNPVIAVVVPKHVAASVRRLAGLRGVSVSAVVRDFLIETQPVLDRISNLLDLAARSDKEDLKRWAAVLERQQGIMETDALAAMTTLDGMQQHLELHKPGRPPAGADRKRSRSERPAATKRRKPQ